MTSVIPHKIRTYSGLERALGIQRETRREAREKVHIYKVFVALVLSILGIADCSGTTPVAHTPAFVHAANNASDDVSAYNVTPSTGALTAVGGSPYPAGTAPVAIAADPSGKFLYVAHNTPGSVRALSIGATGALTLISGSPFAAGLGTDAVVTAKIR